LRDLVATCYTVEPDATVLRIALAPEHVKKRR